MKLGLSIIISILLTASLFAQKGNITVEVYPDSPKADKLPLPDYPKIAKSAGLGGRVSVEVVLDEKGNVASADNADGPYPICKSVTEPKVMALRNAALAAAKKARFRPIDGQSINGKRIYLVFNFVTDQNPEARYILGDAKVEETPADKITLGVIGKSETGSGINPNLKLGEGKGIDTVQPPTTSTSGILNGKATVLPKPIYPPAAKAIRASGAVYVVVLIYEDGSVYSAQADTGHPLLRRSSEIAACGAKFAPSLLSGEPVKVHGLITYNYTP